MKVDFLTIVKLMAALKPEELNAFLDSVKKIGKILEDLKKPGNTQEEIIQLLREVSVSLQTVADILDTSN